MSGSLGASLFRLAVLGALASAAAPASGEGEQKACKLATSKDWDGFTLVVDANTGERLAGGTQFPQGSQIKVIVTRKNPFKYSYRVQTVVTPLEEAIALAFLKQVVGLPELSELSGFGSSLLVGDRRRPGA